MHPSERRKLWRRFLAELWRGVRVAWPILSAVLLLELALGLLVGFVEGWPIGDTLYFTFVTGLTIGYGDVVPRHGLARALAVAIGFCGILMTALVAAIAVHAMQAALAERP
jgi:voltage-gated potassium channel